MWRTEKPQFCTALGQGWPPYGSQFVPLWLPSQAVRLCYLSGNEATAGAECWAIHNPGYRRQCTRSHFESHLCWSCETVEIRCHLLHVNCFWDSSNSWQSEGHSRGLKAWPSDDFYMWPTGNCKTGYSWVRVSGIMLQSTMICTGREVQCVDPFLPRGW